MLKEDFLGGLILLLLLYAGFAVQPRLRVYVATEDPIIAQRSTQVLEYPASKS